MQAKPSGEERARTGALLERSAGRHQGGATALIALLLLGFVSLPSLHSSDQKTAQVAVSVAEEILLAQSSGNVNLKVRLTSGVRAQVWGDAATSCSSPAGSLNETVSGTYTIPLNTIPFGSNQNNYICVQSSDGKLNANVAWPHTPASVAFVQQPVNTAAAANITPAVAVEVLDSTGTLISSSTASITLAIGTNPGSNLLPMTQVGLSPSAPYPAGSMPGNSKNCTCCTKEEGNPSEPTSKPRTVKTVVMPRGAY